MAPTSPITREELANVPDFELSDTITLGTVTMPRIDRGSAAAPPSQAAASVAAAPAPAVAAPAPIATTPQAIAAGGFEHSDDIDDEIREVFLEELDEEIRHLGDLLPVWHEAPEDSERLRPIRRVFHTLKGSGRLVGAKTLGEFSWKIENLLNRVLDGTRPASPAVIGLVGHVYTALPQLHAALRNEGAITADLAGMEAHADRLAEGDETLYTPARGDCSAPLSQPVVARRAHARSRQPRCAGRATLMRDPNDDRNAGRRGHRRPAASLRLEPGMPASVDAVLLEILDAEVSGHLVTIEQWLAAANARPAPGR